jgi:dihydropteroate synthase
VAAVAARGVSDIWVDPGIGFGKTLEHNLALLNAIPRLREETGRPVLIGASRKRFIQMIDARAEDARHGRLGGSVAAALLAAQQGASIVRVHDVAETVQALKVWRALNPA